MFPLPLVTNVRAWWLARAPESACRLACDHGTRVTFGWLSKTLSEREPYVITLTLTDVELSNQSVVVNLLNILIARTDILMTSVQDIRDAAAAEKAEVQAKLDELAAKIQALMDAQAGGTLVSEADMASILTDVQNIFVATPNS
jgi:hypothetical protein